MYVLVITQLFNHFFRDIAFPITCSANYLKGSAAKHHILFDVAKAFLTVWIYTTNNLSIFE